MNTEPLFAIFVGTGGYPDEKIKAAKIFEVGHTYEVEKGWMGRSHTDLKLKGIQGQWNSVLFHVEQLYAIFSEGDKTQPQRSTQIKKLWQR